MPAGDSHDRGRGWSHARPPVVVGRPPGSVAVADLGDGHLAGIEALHVACRVIADVVLSVWVFDGMTLDPDPTQMGLTDAPPSAQGRCWVGDVRPYDRPVALFHRACMDAVAPIMRRAASEGRVPERSVRRVALDSLDDHLRRLLKHSPTARSDEAVGRFLDAERGRSRMLLSARPDEGPPVELAVPTICCVLSGKLEQGACPTCPRRRSHEERGAEAEAWLRSLDGDEFRYITGRDRVGPG